MSFTSSSLCTNFEAIDRIAMNDVPFKISAIGPKNSCQVLAANAYTKLEIIFDIEDKTPMIASSIFRRWEKTPTEKSVPSDFKQ